MRRALLLLCLLPLGCQRSGPQVWSRGGVSVLIHELRATDEGYADYRIEVSDGTRHYCYGSGALGNPGQRRASFADVIAMDGYLFVPASCGGGNASKCQGYQAFATKPKLAWLGNVTGKWDGNNVVPYQDGVFYDTGDMLEINDLLNHAESPRYPVAYTEAQGQLSFDAERTWKLNAEGFAAAPDDAAGLLFKAGIAKLCGKATELKAVQAQAARILNQQGRDLFKKALAQVKTKDVQPNAFIPVGECPPAEKP
jgi:hypothetical protein